MTESELVADVSRVRFWTETGHVLVVDYATIRK